ncbi:MAG: manganese efflux pump, partial [Brevundimonas sp.]
LAFIGANIWVIATAIGATTFVASTTGMLVGKVVGARFGRYAELAGGVALIIIGTLILIDHLGAV